MMSIRMLLINIINKYCTYRRADPGNFSSADGVSKSKKKKIITQTLYQNEILTIVLYEFSYFDIFVQSPHYQYLRI